jgi:hypothetical protein
MPQGPGIGVLSGSKNMANAQQGSPATGETCRSPSSLDRLEGLPNPKTPGRRGRVGPRRSEAATPGGIAGRAQESGETGRQESEPFLVPWKSGNSSREDPAEGRGGRVTDPRSGHKARTPSLRTLSTKRPRIA